VPLGKSLITETQRRQFAWTRTGFQFTHEIPIFSAPLCLCGDSILAGRTIAAMIAKGLLEILVCPACRQALEYRENPESLKCRQCHRVYAVKDDIPIMLVDEAKIEEPTIDEAKIET
jgi:LSD1 subclass zinc finger protein